MTFPIVTRQAFGQVDGEKVELIKIVFEGSMEVELINYGGIIKSLSVPDKNGKLENVVLGYDSLARYREDQNFLGAVIGRYANRIEHGKFSLEGQNYQLPVNNGPNHLHGGVKGFNKVVWKVEEIDKKEESVIIGLTYLSQGGEEGYPGNLKVQVRYIFDIRGFEVQYEAVTDKKTIVNLTQHSYFNLSADFNQEILDHELILNADEYLPIDKDSIPLGNLQRVKNSPFDFTKKKLVGKDIDLPDEQLEMGHGYDHCFVLNNKGLAATLHHKSSGRTMEVFTDKPGIQLYTGNFIAGKGMKRRSALCLETQLFPNSPNEPTYRQAVLAPGEKYISKTAYRFKA